MLLFIPSPYLERQGGLQRRQRGGQSSDPKEKENLMSRIREEHNEFNLN